MPINTDAIHAGAVVRLDTTVLRSLGGAQTNAEAGPHGDRAVTGVHDFLVVHVDASTAVCTAVPLFNKSAVGNQPLTETLKSGPADNWRDAPWYFSRWQHWRIPGEQLVAALAPGEGGGPLRRYAAGDPSARDDIRAWESRNRAPYRPA